MNCQQIHLLFGVNRENNIAMNKKDRAAKAGLGPGSLIHVGKKRDEQISIRVMNYTSDSLEERTITDLEECHQYRTPDTITWLDFDGIHDPRMVEKVGAIFGIHILVQEDIMNSTSRPKVEVFEDFTFVTLKMLDFQSTTKTINEEQFSLIIGKGFLLTFQERPGDDFDSIRDRIRMSTGRVRTKDSEYLAYLLLDVIVDNYIKLSQDFYEKIEALEPLVLSTTKESVINSILALRKELIHFKRSVDPLKEAINTLHNETENENKKYYRDLFDHIIYESENIAMYREMLGNLIDLYHSRITIRTNDVMRVLTIITTIFVPLTFIVGVYGMNFKSMPELYWEHGYYYVWGLMILIVMGMIVFFKRQKWI